jgi:hypothetical protein
MSTNYFYNKGTKNRMFSHNSVKDKILEVQALIHSTKVMPQM